MTEEKDKVNPSSSESDGDEYELDLPSEESDQGGDAGEAGRSLQSESSGKRPKGSPETSGSREDDAGEYELAETEEEPVDTGGAAGAGSRSMTHDPNADQAGYAPGSDASESVAEPPPPPSDQSTSDRPTSSVYKPEGDPDSIDPEVARMRREEQRQRRALEEAEDDAKRRKRIWIGVGLVIGTIVVILILTQLF